MNHQAAWLYIKRLVDQEFQDCDARLKMLEEAQKKTLAETGIENSCEYAIDEVRAKYEQIEQLAAIMIGIQDGDIDPVEAIKIVVDPSMPSNQVDIRHPDGSLAGRIVNVGSDPHGRGKTIYYHPGDPIETEGRPAKPRKGRDSK
jgi:hypothetical protein